MATDKTRATSFVIDVSDARQPLQRREIHPAVDDRVPEAIDPAYLSTIQEGRAQIRRSEYAADAEIEDIYNSVGL